MYKTDKYYIKYKTFELWISKLSKIGMQQRLDRKGKTLFQCCCLLLCLVKRSSGNIFKANEFSYEFDSMMNHYYKYLNHAIFADVLENTSVRNGIRTRSFPIAIDKSNILYVYFDTFLRIVNVHVNHDYEIYINIPHLDLESNWRGKDYCYAYTYSTPITGWSKIKKNIHSFITNLRYEKEEMGDCKYWQIIDNDIFEDKTRQQIENHIFKCGCTWPPIDYDCMLEYCDCNGINDIDIEMCRKTSKQAMKLTKEKLLKKKYLYERKFH